MSPPAPRWARWFVGAFLGLFVASGLLNLDTWPFTGWRLFSHLRSEQVESWQAAAVDSTGDEGRFPFRLLPAGDRHADLALRGFDSLGTADRAALCRTWAGSARAAGADVSAVRLYRVRGALWPRAGDRASETASRTLVFECRGDGP